MKIYVAGKWQEKEQVRQLQQGLRDRGHTITYDWTQQEEEGAVLHCCALNDASGVIEADSLVARLVNPLPYRGALAEIGMAIGLGKRVYIIGHGCPHFIFECHPLVTKFSNTKKFFDYMDRVGV